MDKKKATSIGNSGDGQTSKQPSTTSEGAVGRRRAEISLVQSVLLIWLDNNIDEGSEDYRNIITELRRVVNAVSTFTGGDECIEFISANNNEKVCMIISNSLGQLIVPLVHNMPQVDSIFIFCDNRQQHEQWAKEWPKIKGVFTEISPVCDALKQAVQECEHNATSISFMSTNGEASNENVDQLNCSFMYTQILKEILLTMEFGKEYINELTNHCREVFAGNDAELNNVNELEHKYRDKTPIWWYTCEGFLYPMLNRALRTMEVEIIIKMGFFISDLHRHIEQLHTKQFDAHPKPQVLTFYRGQGLSKTDFDQLVKTKGGLMAFDSFLSTSKNHNISLDFARKVVSNPDMVGILFVMSIDPSKSTTPFASITEVSYYQDSEDEILFSMHTVFRIREIKRMSENNRLWQVELTLTSDNDKDLRVLTERIREEIKRSTGWHRLSKLMMKMGQSKKAEQIYEVMLQQASDEDEKAIIYHRFGWLKYNQGQYEEAITLYEKSLEIRQRILPPTHPDLADSYNNIGSVYDEMGECSEALTYYEKALEIQQKILPSTHPDLTGSYNNLGNVYYNMDKYSEALSYYQKALEIKKKILPPAHPDLAGCYNNIGVVYFKMGAYSKALSYYNTAVEIRQKSIPSTYPGLAASYNNIGAVYFKVRAYSKALSYYNTAVEIGQNTLPLTYPDLAISYYNIGEAYCNMGEYTKALSYYEKTLEIQEKMFPPTHPDLAMSYNNIGIVYKNMGEYSKAISYYGKALEIKQKTLPSNHPDLAGSYNNIGVMYYNMGEYLKALSFYERAVDIGQRSLRTNHPHLQLYIKHVYLVKKKL